MHKISTLIPTHNSLPYLKLCVRTFKKYSLPDNRLIVHVDGSTDGTRDWLKQEGIEHTYDEWKGIPHAVNTLARKADSEYIGFMNDDIAFSPDWDKHVLSWLKEGIIICPELVEPNKHDFGRIPEEFNEKAFIEHVKKTAARRLEPKHWGMWFMKRDLFFKNGLHDLNYSPYGMEDIDFYMRLMQNFPQTRVYVAHDFMIYHFVAASKSKAADWKEIGPRIDSYFAEKWGMSVARADEKLREWLGYSRKTNPEPKIAVIMLTLNEEPRIQEALKQFKLHVDYILVVDGGSTDRTVELATPLADKIIYDARDNIGVVKNQARKHVAKDCNWLLWADADEKWDKGFLQIMKRIIVENKGQPGVMRFPRLNLPGGKDYPDWQVRIFPNSRDIEWRGQHHETPWIMNFYPEDRPLDQVNKEEEKKAGMPTIPIFNGWDYPIVHLPRRKKLKRPWW